MCGAGLIALAALPGSVRGEEMLYPLSVAVAGDDALLVADRMLPGLLKLQAGSTEVFFQGKKTFRTPLNAVRAVAVAADGTVHAADSATRDVFKFVDGQPVPLTQGKIGIPVDIAFDPSGDLFVSDLETQRIWRVPAAGGEPKEVAQLAAPRGLFVDGAGRLWAVAASGEQPLVRIAADGSIEPVVKERVFEFPHDVVVADDGTAYVSDNYARAVWKVAADGTASKWITGEPLKGPVGLAIRAGKVLIADPQAKTVWEADSEGKLNPLHQAAK
jgi:sugar lactone lactonase YvrE